MWKTELELTRHCLVLAVIALGKIANQECGEFSQEEIAGGALLGLKQDFEAFEAQRRSERN